MSASLELLHVLQAQDIHTYVSFPDKWLGPFLRALDADPAVRHVPATIEREALGIAVGAQLAGARSALVMQNSGIGNILNDWASLAFNYGIPIPWIASDRGSLGEQVTTQMIWHGHLRALLDTLRIPTQTFYSAAQLNELSAFIEDGYTARQSVAALFPYVFWHDDLAVGRAGVSSDTSALSPIEYQPVAEAAVRHGSRASWRRYDALTCLLDALTDEFLFVNLGDPCKEVCDIRDRAETFYMLGSMGLVLPLGLGFAQTHSDLGRERKTVVIDGDGSQLMQMGSLGTLAREQPDLALVIVDNASYGSTGDQPTLTGTHVDLEGVARAFGLSNTATVGHPQAFEDCLSDVLSTPGPSVTVVQVQAGAPSTPLVPHTPLEIAERFQIAAEAADLSLAAAVG